MRSLPQIFGCSHFINVDEIAHGISPLDPRSALVRAGRIFLDLLEERLQQREDFSFETTLSGRSNLVNIPRWQAQGWRVILFYLYIPVPELCILRVRQRVATGGHDVPQEDILRRYHASLRNLFLYTDLCDHVICFDNSHSQQEPVFEKDKNEDFHIFNPELFDSLCHTYRKK